MVTSTKSAVAYDWREDMKKAATLKDREGKAKAAAGAHLWRACKAGIAEWIDSGTDEDGEALYGEFLSLYGESRKGDCSKMRTVALAVANNGLDPEMFDNLSKAYAEARRLTKTVVEEAAEDDAAEAAVAAIEPPKTASTVEAAAKILLSKGVDGAVVAILDALNGPTGENNVAAHRAFLRAVTTEVAARVKPPKAEQVEADSGSEPKPAQPKQGASKAKAKPAAAKAKPVQRKAEAEPEDTAEDEQAVLDEEPESVEEQIEEMFEGLDDEADAEDTEPQPVSTPKVPVGRPGKARPAVKRPARR